MRFANGLRGVAGVVLTNLYGSINFHRHLVSFAFNVGLGNLQSSTLRMKYNRGDFEGAADEFLKWTKAGGKVLNGLVRRREAERALFLTSG